MKNRVKAKIYSESGASISFALLIFLVCAVLSAAILVAGSAAAGRMAGIAETDQKYYSVTSAAGLLRDKLNDKPVSVVKYNEDYYYFDKSMNEIVEQDVYDSDYTGENKNEEGKTSPDTLNGSMAELYMAVNASNSDSLTREITIEAEGLEEANTVVTEKMDKDGDILFTIRSVGSNSSAGYKPYTVMIGFGATVKDVDPPVTKVEGIDLSGSKEITWHMTKMVSDYDVAN